MESESHRRRPDGQREAPDQADANSTKRPGQPADESGRDLVASRAGSGEEPGEEPGEEAGPIPDMVRRALSIGLAGFFSTEQTIRKALGDTLPKEWIDFMTDQSERTRSDLTDAIASEVGRTLKSIDLTQVADQLLTGRTLEVSARIRLLPADDEASEPEGSDT